MQSSSYSQLGNAAATGEYGARPSPRGSVLQMQKANKGPSISTWQEPLFASRGNGSKSTILYSQNSSGWPASSKLRSEI